MPMVQREGKDHIMDCYFCMINLKGINCKNKQHVQYLYVLSAIPHGPNLPVSEPDGNMEYSSDSEHNDMIVFIGDDAYKPEEDNQPVPLTQAELNDLTQDLNLSKESAQLLGSCLKEKHLLAPGITFCWYQDHDLRQFFIRELRQFYMFQGKSLVYCNNIAGLIKSMGLCYGMKTFIDSSSRSLKAVVLHNGNSFSSILIEDSVQMKETHNSIDH